MKEIAILRGGGIGDIVLAVPAIKALARTFTKARITLYTSAFGVALFTDRAGAPHRVLEIPKYPGINTPEISPVSEKTKKFFDIRRNEKIDIALQMHGGGKFSNPFIKKFRANITAGTQTNDAISLDRNLRYVYYQHQIARWLEVAHLVGAPKQLESPAITVTAGEVSFGEKMAVKHPNMVILHPGATDQRRRWLEEKFAKVIATLISKNFACLLIGSGAEKPLNDRVEYFVRKNIQGNKQKFLQNLTGKLNLNQLIGLLYKARIFIGNDSGPRHLAEAVGCKTVSIFWFGNLLNAGPLFRQSHRTQTSWVTNCPVCQIDVTQVGWTAKCCKHNESFVKDIRVEAVLADIADLIDD